MNSGIQETNQHFVSVYNRYPIILGHGVSKCYECCLGELCKRAFTVSIADTAHVVEADYFGVTSGNNILDKLKKSGLTASRAEMVDAPVINEFPLCLECQFIEYQNNDYGFGVIGRVLNVTADERVMPDGKLDCSVSY